MATTLEQTLFDLRLPILQAPMFLVSSHAFAQAGCRAGLIVLANALQPDRLHESRP